LLLPLLLLLLLRHVLLLLLLQLLLLRSMLLLRPVLLLLLPLRLLLTGCTLAAHLLFFDTPAPSQRRRTCQTGCPATRRAPAAPAPAPPG
jgi:hypothetical protein